MILDAELDPQLILILLTIGGAILAAVLGWGESGEPFDSRKFGCSVGRAIIAGATAAMIFQDVEVITPWTYLSALLVGAGIDVMGHRASGVFRRVRGKPS